MIKDFVDVSVVIPCFRCKETIERALDSILSQSLIPSEIIIIDDYSNDGTLEFLYKLQLKYSNYRIKIISLSENMGPGSARNVGWNIARSKYISFLDADDSWHPQKIEIQYTWMLKYPEVALTTHDCRQLGSSDSIDNSVNQMSMPVYAKPLTTTGLLLSNSISTRSVMLRRDLKQRFKERKYYSEDYLLWLQLICTGEKIYRINGPISYSYKSLFEGEGLSGQFWNMYRGELETYRILQSSHYISFISFSFFAVLSSLKLFRRLFLYYSKK